MSADQLQDDLIAEILSWLPAIFLLRLRCVSKSWRDLIDSPNFTKSHLSRNRITQISLFEFVGADSSEMNLEFTGFDLINCSVQLNILSGKVHFSPLYATIGSRFIGSCGGLICFSSLYEDEIVLVNPLSREEDCHIFAPKSRRVGCCDAGIGYDPFSNGYKVVLMKRCEVPEREVEVNIYDFNSKTWKQMYFQSNYNHFFASVHGFYTHGALHWILQNPGQTSPQPQDVVYIAIFDLVSESLKVVTYDADMFGHYTSFSLAILGGCLSLCCEREGFGMDLWVMKKYGVKESWSKLVSFDYDVVPFALSFCGRRLLLQIIKCSWPSSGSLYWYDLDNKSFECTDHTRSSYGFHVCQPSL